jgi:hypothetical protein
VAWVTLTFQSVYLQLRFLDENGQSRHVHEHPADVTCHWADVFRPLAFLLPKVGNAILQEKIPQLAYESEEWTKWLCRLDEATGSLNMVKLLQQVSLYLPEPFIAE